MKDISKKWIVSLLCASVVTTSFSFDTKLIHASSQNSNESTHSTTISNFQLINEDISKYEYTYDQNSESYKIIENANHDLTQIYSTIYKKDALGNYNVIDIKETEFIKTGDETVEVRVKENGNVTSQQLIVPATNSSSVQPDQSLSTHSSIAPSSSGITGWQTEPTTYYSNNITTYTVLGISAAIAQYAPWAPLKWLNAVASGIYMRNTPTIYYTTYNAGRYIIPTTIPVRTQIALRRTTVVYSDNARTQQVGQPNVYEKYSDGFGPNGPL